MNRWKMTLSIFTCLLNLADIHRAKAKQTELKVLILKTYTLPVNLTGTVSKKYIFIYLHLPVQDGTTYV